MPAQRLYRRAITLVELLVVMTILGTLAAIVATFAPRMLEQSRVPQGAAQLQGWLQIARQRAIRDQAPCGLRLINPGLPPTTSNQNLYNQFVYVHQPDDISLSTVELPAPQTSMQTAASNALTALSAQATAQSNTPLANFYSQYANLVGSSNPSGWQYLLLVPGRTMQGTFLRGDVVEFGSTRYYLVCDAVVSGTNSILVLHRVRDEIAAPSTPLPMARITRSARPVAGEPEVNLPVGVAVDFIKTTLPATNVTRSWPAPDTNQPAENVEVDIMFSRTGEVIGGLGTYGRIVLWVRDTTLGEPAARGGLPPGDNRVIVIHTRTGQVTAHPVHQDMDASGKLLDPYRFIRDGKSSAME